LDAGKNAFRGTIFAGFPAEFLTRNPSHGLGDLFVTRDQLIKGI
jgi:hypothetical protein